MRRFFPILLIICIIIISCKKPKVYSIIPSIKFVSFNLIDSTDGKYHNHDPFGILTFSFIDGDGDIGLSPDDLNPPYDTSSIYYYDLFIDILKKVNSTYDTVKLPIPYNYRLPDYENLGKDKSLQGRIIVAMQYPKPIPWDTIRYSFYIFDRALHKSNIVTTPDLILK